MGTAVGAWAQVATEWWGRCISRGGEAWSLTGHRKTLDVTGALINGLEHMPNSNASQQKRDSAKDAQANSDHCIMLVFTKTLCSDREGILSTLVTLRRPRWQSPSPMPVEVAC